jgi:hypothetical protein
VAVNYVGTCNAQLLAIDSRRKIEQVIEGEPLAAVSEKIADNKIEGFVSNPRNILGKLFSSTVYWRYAVTREEAKAFCSIAELRAAAGACGYLILYKRSNLTGILVLNVRHNSEYSHSNWWSKP